MEFPDIEPQLLNMPEETNLLPLDHGPNEQESTSVPRRQSYTRSMSVPNSVPNDPLFPNQEESIPSVTISDFSSHEHVSNRRVFTRFNSLPKTDEIKLCCRRHGYNKPVLSPALSMNNLVDNEDFSDAEPETP